MLLTLLAFVMLLYRFREAWALAAKMVQVTYGGCPSTNFTKGPKRILLWNDDYSPKVKQRYWNFGGVGKEVFLKSGCPVWQCEVFDHREWNETTIPVEDFDAVVIHDPMWPRKHERPAKRSPHQRYVFWTQESPGFHRHMSAWQGLKDYFNWTMTYRWDSDIVHTYGYVVPLNTGRKEPMINYAQGKTRMAAWFVSNCNATGRSEYVRRLQRYVDVDIYGRCGNLTCPRSEDDSCRKMLEAKYKFYISFENSNCLDYVTEKLFDNLQLRVVPIVMDLNGNYARLAPPGSFINALDFPTVQTLADYLLLLDRNDTLYNQYFEWKDRYEVRNKPEQIRQWLCRFCSLLYEDTNKVYHDLNEWWVKGSRCQDVTFGDTDNMTWRSEPVPLSDRIPLFKK